MNKGVTDLFVIYSNSLEFLPDLFGYSSESFNLDGYFIWLSDDRLCDIWFEVGSS
jgi:hypothetical protein